jgi:hypothetical protein
MTTNFTPRLDILPPPQRRLWDELAAVPTEFVLYGGTAIALHLGQRQSMGFDFFGDRPLDPALLAPAVPFLPAQSSRSEHQISSVARLTVAAWSNCFSSDCPGSPRLLPPLVAPDIGLRVASTPC